MIYFGENQKTSQPNVTFPVLQRFVDGFIVSEIIFISKSPVDMKANNAHVIVKSYAVYERKSK